MERNGLEIKVTSLERTLVDLFDKPALGGGWEEIWRSLESVEFYDVDKVVDYALLLKKATTVAKVGVFVAEVVRGRMEKREAAGWIAKKAAAEVTVEDKTRFIEVVETELSGLHEGNIVRYCLRLSEFKDWYQGWRQG